MFVIAGTVMGLPVFVPLERSIARLLSLLLLRGGGTGGSSSLSSGCSLRVVICFNPNPV